MGSDYLGQWYAVMELRALSDDAKIFMGHHFRNSISVIIAAIQLGRYDDAIEEAWHMETDLRKIGC